MCDETEGKTLNFDHETLTPGMGKLKSGAVIKGRKVSVTSGKKKASVRKETECCQDDSVNCSCFRKDKMKLKACSIHVRARVRMSVVQLSCVCLWRS